MEERDGVNPLGYSDISGSERIYRIPPERRDGVLHRRTAILQALHKLDQQGKLPDVSSGAAIPLCELIHLTYKELPLGGRIK